MYHSREMTSPSGVTMPPLIYGTAWKAERTADLVVQAVRCGFRGIDTACQPKHYREAGVGDALQRLAGEGVPRESLFVQTKFTPLEGHDPKRIPYDPAAPLAAQVAQSFETSLRNLKTEYVDSLVLHSPLFPHSRLMEVWEAMQRIAETGRAKQLGISNCYDPGWFQRLCGDARIAPAVVQNRFYADSGYDRELRAWCRERGIVYQSFWTLTANPHVLAAPELRDLARKHGKSGVQLLFNHLNRSGIIPLTGTTSTEHMASDLQSFDFDLDAEEHALIDALLH